MKVLVILHDNRFDVLEIPILVYIVVGGDHNAEGKLLILAYVVSLLIVILLLLGYLIHYEPIFIHEHFEPTSI